MTNSKEYRLTSDFKIEDTQDLRVFFQTLLHWSETNTEKEIFGRLKAAENRSMSASELLISYAEVLQDLQRNFSNRLPEQFRSFLSKAILVAEDGVNLGSYTYKTK